MFLRSHGNINIPSSALALNITSVSMGRSLEWVAEMRPRLTPAGMVGVVSLVPMNARPSSAVLLIMMPFSRKLPFRRSRPRMVWLKVAPGDNVTEVGDLIMMFCSAASLRSARGMLNNHSRASIKTLSLVIIKSSLTTILLGRTSR
jgi:hypothetical protein